MFRHKLLTGRIIGAAIQVHREIGPGFREVVYRNALCEALSRGGISFERDSATRITFHGLDVGSHRVELLVADRLVVGVRAVAQLRAVHFAIVRSHLRFLGRTHGLLLNFGKPALEVRRVWVGSAKVAE